MRKLLPEHQLECLAFGGAQPAERREQALVQGIRCLPRRPGTAVMVSFEAGEQVAEALPAAVLPGDHAPRYAIEPQPVIRRGRYVVQPPPGGREHVGNDVGHVGLSIHSPHRVRLERAVIFLVERAETAFSLITGVRWLWHRSSSPSAVATTS